MTLPRCFIDSTSSKKPWVLATSLPFITLLFSAALASVTAISGWWFDDLYSLWASDPATPFNIAFKERIITDSNPPLYFSLLYFLRQVISDDKTAVIAMNVGAIIAAGIAVYIPSRRVGLNGLAIAGIAAFALSGPVLYFGPEGRSYVMALSIAFVASWYAAMAIAGFPEQLTLKRAVALGCLAALTHVYAALFCGSLAAGLLVLAGFGGRREFVKPALALGLSASVVFGIWLSIAFETRANIDWIVLSTRNVLNAALSVKQLAVGSNWQLFILMAIFIFGLFNRRSRPLFIVFCVCFLLFALLPIIVSFVQPIIRNRYWQIGGAALPVLAVFAARLWILEGLRTPSRLSLTAGGAALFFLGASCLLGFANATHYMPSKPFWRGADIVRPLLARCEGSSVHVYYENPSVPFVSFPWEMWDFQKLTGAPSSLFKDPRESATPFLKATASSCPVLGWAEDSLDWQKLSDAKLLKLLKIEASMDEVTILRQKTGFVILKRSADKPSS